MANGYGVIYSTGKKLPEYLSADDARTLISYGKHPTAKLAMLFGWRAGLRASEIVGVEPAHIDYSDAQPTLKVWYGKGPKQRIVPLHPELLQAVQLHQEYGVKPLEGKRGPRLTPNVNKDALLPFSRNAVNNWVDDAYKSAAKDGKLIEGRRVFPHILRHSAARHWLANGVPINVVQLWLGHEDMRTTLIYLKLIPDVDNRMQSIP